MEKLKVGDVIETISYHLITRMDDDFIYARKIYPYISLGEEIILFTQMNFEKEYTTIGVKSIIDMNEVTRRYLELA